MPGLSGQDKTQSLAGLPGYYSSSTKYGGGRGQQTFGTPYSSISSGNVTLDPSIRAMQDQYLNQYTGATGDYTSFLNQLMGNYQGNQSAFMQAAVDPLKQAGSQALGAAAQGYGLRGLGGSSFASDSLAGLSSDIGRQIGDVQSQALNQQLGAQSGIAGQRLGAQQQLSDYGNQVALQRFQQEMGALGLGLNQQQLLQKAFEEWQQRAMADRSKIAETSTNWIGGMRGGGGGTPSAGSSGGGSNYNMSSIGQYGYNPQME